MATFSKKHYEAVARALRKARDQADASDVAPTHVLWGVGMVEAELASMFAEDNPAFDGQRFADATGCSPYGGTMRRDLDAIQERDLLNTGRPRCVKCGRVIRSAEYIDEGNGEGQHIVCP